MDPALEAAKFPAGGNRLPLCRALPLAGAGSRSGGSHQPIPIDISSGRVLFLCAQLLRRHYLSHAQAYCGGLLIIAICKLLLWN